ncbi:Oxysterol-binding protein OBPa, partial [Spiromyces aspiralis]
ASAIDDDVERFIQGVKKPYNPILGEFFRCQYSFDDDSKSFYISEQVSHHPPITAMYYNNPQHAIRIRGEIRPLSKFFGNSVGMILDHKSYGAIYLDRHNEEYRITYPNMYARGILFGKMMLELGEKSTVTCEKLDLRCEVEFKTKGLFSGQYNQIEGRITRISDPRETLYCISGNWQTRTFIKDFKTGESSVLFDSSLEDVVLKEVPRLEEQEENESRWLWQHVTEAIKTRDQNMATTEKTKIEEAQRKAARQRLANNEEWVYRFFRHVPDEDIYLPMIKVDGNEIESLPSDPEEASALLQKWIFTKPDGSIPNCVKDDMSSIPL